jgi:hypothetical protein
MKERFISISMETLIQTVDNPVAPGPMFSSRTKEKKSVGWNDESKITRFPDERTRIQKFCQIFTPPSRYICFTADKLEFMFSRSESLEINYPGIPLVRALESQVPAFSRLDKLALSAALAHSVLWLHPTEWMEPSFNICNFHVVVIKTDQIPSFKRLYLNREIPATHPSPQWLSSTQYVSAAQKFLGVSKPREELIRSHSLPQSGQEISKTSSVPFIRNQTMFSLGLTLIQLCLGKKNWPSYSLIRISCFHHVWIKIQ